MKRGGEPRAEGAQRGVGGEPRQKEHGERKGEAITEGAQRFRLNSSLEAGPPGLGLPEGRVETGSPSLCYPTELTLQFIWQKQAARVKVKE